MHRPQAKSTQSVGETWATMDFGIQGKKNLRTNAAHTPRDNCACSRLAIYIQSHGRKLHSCDIISRKYLKSNWVIKRPFSGPILTLTRISQQEGEWPRKHPGIQGMTPSVCLLSWTSGAQGGHSCLKDPFNSRAEIIPEMVNLVHFQLGFSVSPT